jgi:rod shape-determining protein MreD
VNRSYFIDIALGIVFVILQVVFFRHLMLFGMYPDVVLIFLLWYMKGRTRTAAVLMAFFTGFLQDALLDLWGLNLISKILLAFFAQPFIDENMQGRNEIPRVITVVFLAAVIHNLIFLLLSFAVKEYSAELLFWRHWLGNAVFTAIIAGILQFFKTSIEARTASSNKFQV